jgi:hypothetical protein
MVYNSVFIIIQYSALYLAENLGKTQLLDCDTLPEDKFSDTESPTIP